MLWLGIIPELEANGYTVAVCREWSAKSDQPDAAVFLDSKIRGVLPQEYQNAPQGDDLFWALEDGLGRRAVLVLDQFEELIRYAPPLAARIYKLLLNLNRFTNIKVILSFRSEFMHMLRPLEDQAKPFTMSHFLLAEIDEKYASEVVKTTKAAARHKSVDKVTKKLIVDRWMAARTEASTTVRASRSAIGILQLQALLYALHAKAKGRVIDKAAVLDMQGLGSALELLLDSVEQSIVTKLARCKGASREAAVQLDECLIEGTDEMVARAVPNLSSGGYKLIRDAEDLAQSAFGDTLSALREAIAAASPDGLGVSDAQYHALFRAVIDVVLLGEDEAGIALLDSGREEFARRADAMVAAAEGATWSARLSEGRAASDPDRADAPCGPMNGLPPAAVLVEELRRFAFALKWMEESDLARLSNPGEEGTQVALVHDGFGDALQRWADTARSGAGGPLNALTAPKGAIFIWKNPDDQARYLTGDETNLKVLANLRWKGLFVSSRFTRVAFVNCDLRGTIFKNCDFAGVTFMNCVLDGVILWKCRVTGEVKSLPTDINRGVTVDEEPTFAITPANTDLVSIIGRYRGTPTGGKKLFSPLPGCPAVPEMETPHKAEWDWIAEPGGLVIYGGRLSGLLVRDCTLIDEPASEFKTAIALRYVAGSGVDFVEQSHGRFEIVGSALRHCTFAALKGGIGHFNIEIKESVISQIWLGANLTGGLEVSDSMLVHAVNCSPKFIFTADKPSAVHGTVGLQEPCAAGDMGSVRARFAMDDIDPDGTFRRRSEAMDYQSRSAPTPDR